MDKKKILREKREQREIISLITAKNRCMSTSCKKERNTIPSPFFPSLTGARALSSISCSRTYT